MRDSRSLEGDDELDVEVSVAGWTEESGMKPPDMMASVRVYVDR